ncbi:Hypothetical predicted protein [Cloeon dipterum]|uniref:Uncharacterized protein n=1 Tax=Cloeon dipterum TaxID=197152 RepID=A0A8S1BV57_9INSE|nr:Hypothetical predicted protein [Cloeon dipterum]
MVAFKNYWCLVFILMAGMGAAKSRGLWVPRVGMARLLRRPYNPYNLNIERTRLLTRKRLLDSKSSESSSENTDDDDSPDTEEEEDDYSYFDFFSWNYPIEDSNQALEDFSDDESPVITLPKREEMFS